MSSSPHARDPGALRRVAIRCAAYSSRHAACLLAAATKFRALPEPRRKRRFAAAERRRLCAQLGSRIHIQGTKPPACASPRRPRQSAATVSGADLTRAHTHWHTYFGRERDPQHPTCSVSSLPCTEFPQSTCACLVGMRLCPLEMRFCYFGLPLEGEVWGRGLCLLRLLLTRHLSSPCRPVPLRSPEFAFGLQPGSVDCDVRPQLGFKCQCLGYRLGVQSLGHRR
nr:uncharacterized protein LOC105492098 [Macaca nemestrina]